MAERLTDTGVKRLPAPARGNVITWDTAVTGLGARVTAAGHRAFVLAYRTRAGRQRRYTIGSFPDWSVVGAREEARRLKRLVDAGGDPLGEIEAERGAATVEDLIQRFLAEHLPRKRPKTQRDYRRMIELHVRPALGREKVATITWSDIDALHRRITKAGSPVAANRVISMIGKLFTLAVRWHMRPDNPAKGIELNVEHKRRRYPTPAELRRLTVALDQHSDQQAADIFRLCLFTGCRSGEAMSARFDAIDPVSGVWTKPGSTTKQQTTHSAPLSAPARALLDALRRRTNSEWVFPSTASATGYRVSIRKSWRAICKAAGIVGLRAHDLRHGFASQLVSTGASLPLVGALLGHTNPATTARYSHLYDDVQREAVERVGKILTGRGRR
jgi:integrase